MLALKAKKRTVIGGKVRHLRDNNLIPAVVYGHGEESRPLEISYVDFQKLFKKVTESSLVRLELEGEEPAEVLIQEVQNDPLSGRFRHIDFFQVKKGEKLQAEIEISFVGESPAVKAFGGVLVKNFDHITVKCLPNDLVDQIEVDISGLEELGSAIHVKDLAVPAGMEVLLQPDEPVVAIQAPRTAKEVEEAAEAKPEAAAEAKPEAAAGEASKEEKK